MRQLIAVFAAAAIVCVAMVTSPVRNASAEGTTPPPPPQPSATPAPSAAPAPTPKPADCGACATCVAGCGPAYFACTSKCVGQPDMAGCVAKCPSVQQCATACPCSGCSLPGMPH